MGMTLVGQNPTTNLGKVIHFSNWVWQPLVEYLEKNHYDVIKYAPDFRFNSGEVVSEKVATALMESIDVNDAEQWANHLSEFMRTLPEGPCFGCFGLGYKRDGISEMSQDKCEVCDGSGSSKQYVTQYRFRAGDVSNLLLFLRHCGGFKLT